MKYLISEVEFYEPTVPQFKGKVVVIRRDQLEGEKIYIAPEKLMSVAASFSSSEDSVKIPNFADIIIYLKAINASFRYDTSSTTVGIMCDEESIELSYVTDKFLMEVEDFGPSARSLYDFLDSLGLHVMVATSLPRTIDLNEDSEEEFEDEETVEPEDSSSTKVSDDKISEEEKQAVIEDSKDSKVNNVEVVKTVEEMLDK